MTAFGGQPSTITGVEAAFDGSASVSNDMIVSYHWDFGDGNTAYTAEAIHIFDTPGDYEVTLTVTDRSGNEGSETITVTALSPHGSGALTVRVLDFDTGLPLPGATVYAALPGGSLILRTDGQGQVLISAPPGEYRIAAYIQDYLPREITASILPQTTEVATIRLERGEIIVGRIEHRRLTLREIEAVGIDVSAPENQFVHTFTVEMTFNGRPLPDFTFTTNGVGQVIRPPVLRIPTDNGEIQVRPQPVPVPNRPDLPPAVAFLSISGSLSFLKEFFEVSVIMQNMADSQFELVDNTVRLNLPSGLSLAPTLVRQESVQHIAAIAGGETASVSWIVRGDRVGEFDLTADFAGTLMPFRKPVTALFRTEEPLVVNGARGLILYLQPSGLAVAGRDYRIRFRLENKSDINFYMVNMGFDSNDTATGSGQTFEFDRISDIPSNFTVRDGDSIILRELHAGETLRGTYITVFDQDITEDALVWRLQHMFMSMTRQGIPVVVLPGESEEDKPDNVLPLLWPSDSGEVTLWFGIVDDIFRAPNKGIDIQSAVGASVYAIAYGVISDISENIIVMDFLLGAEQMQAHYINVVNPTVSIGDLVEQGDVIGVKGINTSHVAVGNGLLQIQLFNSVGDRVNPANFMVRPEYDINYLSRPMAHSMNLEMHSDGESPDAIERHRRFMANLDLDEEAGEVYLWRAAYNFVLSQGEHITPDEFVERGYLTWDEKTQTATFQFRDIFMEFTVGDANGANDNNDGMDSRAASANEVMGGLSVDGGMEALSVASFSANGDRIENDRVLLGSNRFRGFTRGDAIEISIGQFVRGRTSNSHTGERWYRLRGGFLGGIKITSYGNGLELHVYVNDSPVRRHLHYIDGAGTTSFWRHVPADLRFEWYYFRVVPNEAGNPGSYSFRIDYRIQRPNPSFSAFALGTNVFNLDDGIRPIPNTNSTLSDFDELVYRHPISNPAELFAYHMNRRQWIENAVRVNRYGEGGNEEGNEERPRNATFDEVVASIRQSDIAFIATHGDNTYLHMQDIILNEDGSPTLRRDTRGAEFEAGSIHTRITPENLNLTNSQTAWLVFSACAQLNNRDGRHEAQRWANALIRDGSVHGILGYWGLGPGGEGQLNAINRFFNEAHNRTLVDAWRVANTPPGVGRSRWAVVVNSTNREDRLFRLTDTDTRPATEKVIYRYWGTLNRWSPSDREILQRQRFQNFSFQYDNLDVDLMPSIVANYNVYFSTNSWQTEVMMYSDSHFRLHTPEFDLGYASPITFDEAQAYFYAAEILASLGILPDLHTASIFTVLREDINSLANVIETIEFDVVISPSFRGLRLYNGNEITVRISEFGVTDIFYRWYDIHFDSEVIPFIPFGLNFDIETFLVNGYTVNISSPVYYLDSNLSLRIAFEVMDNVGFVVALVDALTGDIIDKFH